MFDCVMIYRSRSQYSHIYGVPGLAMAMRGHGHLVVARVYQTCFCVSVGHGLATECWYKWMFSVRVRL